LHYRNIADSDILLGLIASGKIKGPLNCLSLNHCDMRSYDRFIVMIKIICFVFFFYKEAYWLIYLKRFVMFCFIIDLFQITFKFMPILKVIKGKGTHFILKF